MAKDLVPIKVKIGLRPNGHADHPNFNLLKSVINSGLDWSKYVDVHGTGWHYDKLCGHKQEDVTSPYGMQWGMLLVPQSFADEAMIMYPNLVTKMTPTECERFYEDRSAARMPSEWVDEDALKKWETKEKTKTLTSEEEAEKAKSLDPNDSTPGIRKNHFKKFADFKTYKGVNIV